MIGGELKLFILENFIVLIEGWIELRVLGVIVRLFDTQEIDVARSRVILNDMVTGCVGVLIIV